MISPQLLTPRSTHGNDRVLPHAKRPLTGRSQDARVVRQFRRLADRIMKEFPATAGGTLLFSGAGSSSHIAEVAEHVARQLSLQPGTVVALVDADADSQVLSERLAVNGDIGLAEVLQRQTSVASAMTATDTHNMRFLPFGDRCNARNPIASDTVRSILVDLRQLCRYTVIAAGTGASQLHAMLSRHCDGTYLVVQLGTAKRQDTSDLARHLTHAGARLLGCVATSVV